MKMPYFSLHLSQDEYEILEDILTDSYVRNTCESVNSEFFISIADKMPSFKYRVRHQ
tara:strand:- start:963 stop:1133 length:171 start_codon:yes stop_codon:yes gene_type:complete